MATFFVTVSFWSMAYGLAVAVAGTPVNPDADGIRIAASGVALAVLLMPAGFGAAAFISRRPDPAIGVLAAMGLAIAFGLPLLAFGNPVVSLIAGYSAGAVVALRRPEGLTWHNRALAAGVVTLVTLGGMAVAFFAIATIAPALPFTAVAVADRVTLARSERLAQ